MRREKLIGLHRAAVQAKRRRPNQTPVDLPDRVELVTHVRRVVVGLDLVQRRRSHANAVWMGRLVQYLAGFVDEDCVAHGRAG